MSGLRDVLACPFCGGAASLLKRDGNEVCNDKWLAGCALCSIQFERMGGNPYQYNPAAEALAKQKATDAWNTRANGPELLAVLADAREQLGWFVEWLKLDGAEFDTTQALLARIDALIGARGDG